MFEHIINQRREVVWSWGPATQYQLDLDGIDSSGESFCDVMEIVTEITALPAAQKLLLDDTLDGCGHALSP